MQAQYLTQFFTGQGTISLAHFFYDSLFHERILETLRCKFRENSSTSEVFKKESRIDLMSGPVCRHSLHGENKKRKWSPWTEWLLNTTTRHEYLRDNESCIEWFRSKWRPATLRVVIHPTSTIACLAQFLKIFWTSLWNHSKHWEKSSELQTFAKHCCDGSKARVINFFDSYMLEL